MEITRAEVIAEWGRDGAGAGKRMIIDVTNKILRSVYREGCV